MQNAIKYPLGVQTFSKIREEGSLYIDKTEYVYNLTHCDSSYIFLSRPRRFGKSLLTSTLKSYFEGRKGLFEGLAIDKLETEWAEHPVLHFDMSGAKHMDVERLERYLDKRLDPYEMYYGITNPAIDANERLNALIERAHIQTGQKVVVLIDEYDAPLLDVVHEEENLPALRQVMRNFYSPLKKCDPHLRFVFITGITKFSQLSIFSELNNLSNVSMDEDYAAICGFTEHEIRSTLMPGVEALAKTQGIPATEALAQIKARYDGYHFCWPSPDIYNPFSLLNALSKHALGDYWFDSGTPTYLIEMMRKFRITPSLLGTAITAKASAFNAPTERLISLTPLLYQSGYITIKDCSPMGIYTLDIPNKEIRIGLMETLLPNYLGAEADTCGVVALQMQYALLNDDINGMLQLLQDFLGTIPSVDYVNKVEHYEAHWQQMLYVIFSLLGANVDVEVRTPRGRVDLVARTSSKVYLFELKLNQDAQTALNQIDLKHYSQRFALCGLPIVQVGISFSPEERNITAWQICPEQ